MVENILVVYHNATKYDISEGKFWYQNARKQCEYIAEDSGLPFDNVVLALAALSPRLAWEKNVSALRRVINGNYTGLLSGNVEKALHLLDGETHWLSGDKVTAFAANILGDDRRVCVDTWALRVWAGDLKLKAWGIKPAEYARIEADYQKAARRLGLAPRELQAITWVTARRLARGKAAIGQLSLDI